MNVSDDDRACDPFPRRRLYVRDTTMAYVDVGSGNPVVFLHGNPTSSYLWRNVIKPLVCDARCIAPDLIGMGDSDRSPRGCYRLFEQAAYLDAFCDRLRLDDVCLVLQDWGVPLGFDWARRHPARVRGIVHMEGILRTMSWAEWPAATREFVRALKGPDGERLVLEENSIVEGFLALGTQRTLAPAEMARYRRPFRAAGAARQPTLDLAREIPLAGDPPDACAMIDANAQWLRGTFALPKLFINAEPGLNVVGPIRDFARTLPCQTEITVPGIHFLQEDSPAEIAAAIRTFLSGLRAAEPRGR